MSDSTTAPGRTPHRVSIVIPVYQGEHTLTALVKEIALLTVPTPTANGHEFQVVELLLVNDHGPDRSDEVIRELAAAHDFIRPVWLSRNFGQHPATLAGMASSSGDWIVTMDEDGQHDPADIGNFLDVALTQGDIQEVADVGGVVLTVLIHRHDPVPAGGGHAGQRRRVLAEVAAEPDRTNEVVSCGQLTDHLIGTVGTMVTDQEQLDDLELVACGGQGGHG